MVMMRKKNDSASRILQYFVEQGLGMFPTLGRRLLRDVSKAATSGMNVGKGGIILKETVVGSAKLEGIA
jgi:hypothetical protein